MKRSTGRRNRTIRYGALTLGFAVACLVGCGDRKSAPEVTSIEPVPPPTESSTSESPSGVENPFSDPDDLLHAIETGSFAKRVHLKEKLAHMVVPATVHVTFESGTAVTEEQVERLEKLALRFQANDDLRVQFVGCSDLAGPADVNQRVSLARAEAVAAKLEELGIESARFAEVVGRGEDCRFPQRVVHVRPFLEGDEPNPAQWDAKKTASKAEGGAEGENGKAG